MQSTERLMFTIWRAQVGWCVHYGEHREAGVHIMESTERLVITMWRSQGGWCVHLWRAQGGWCVQY